MNDSLEVLGILVSIMVLIGFFAIWYLVDKIRKEGEAQTTVLRAMWYNSETGRRFIVGHQGTLKMSLTEQYKFGEVEVDGRTWRCYSAIPIAGGSRVKVRDIENITLIIEPAVADRAVADRA